MDHDAVVSYCPSCETEQLFVPMPSRVTRPLVLAAQRAPARTEPSRRVCPHCGYICAWQTLAPVLTEPQPLVERSA